MNTTNVRSLNGNQQTILDIYRVVAAMFVMLGHGISFFQLTVFKDQTFFPYFQNIGVVIFFLLAGFLSAYSLSNKNSSHKLDFSEYFKHRVSRIYREYLPALLMVVIIDWFSIVINSEHYAYYEAYNIKQFLGNLFMLHNMGPISILSRVFIPFGSARPLWTLPVEWWLYMLFGALYIFICNEVKVTIPKLIMVGFFVCMISDYLITGRGGGLGFVFALGVMIYYIYQKISYKMSLIIFCFSFALYIIYGIIAKTAYSVYSFIILALLFCAGLRIGGGRNGIVSEGNAKRNGIIAFISGSSFILYIIHYSVYDFLVASDLPWSNSIKFLIGTIISFSISFLAYYLFGRKNLLGRLFGIINRRTN